MIYYCHVLGFLVPLSFVTFYIIHWYGGRIVALLTESTSTGGQPSATETEEGERRRCFRMPRMPWRDPTLAPIVRLRMQFVFFRKYIMPFGAASAVAIAAIGLVPFIRNHYAYAGPILLALPAVVNSGVGLTMFPRKPPQRPRASTERTTRSSRSSRAQGSTAKAKKASSAVVPTDTVVASSKAPEARPAEPV